MIHTAMGEQPDIEVQFLRQTDLAEAIRLEESERWNQTEADWKRIQRLCPQGCFAAFCQGSLVGTVTTINYQRKLAWLGMMLVKQEHRGRGIGKRLMSASLNYCKQAGIETIKLDATPAGEPLYASLGFRSEAIVERWEGIAPFGFQRRRGLVGLDDSMRQELHEIDQEAFGADRGELLNALIADAYCDAAVVSADCSRSLAGYGLARRGNRAFYVGPIIAVDQSEAASLLDAILARLQGQKVYLDLLVNSDRDRIVLTDRGFIKQRSLTRMFRGEQINAGMSKMVFAIAGPELG